MKKFLIATTALVLTAGAAAAEVAVSGDGRMGVVYDGDDVNFSSRVRAKFTMSGESDSGLSFGGEIRADNAADGAKGAAGSIWVSGAFGKVAMGDVVGAAEAIHGDMPEIGFTDLKIKHNGVEFSNDIPFLTGDGKLTGTDNPVMLYTYSMDAFDFALSMNDGINNQLAKTDANYKTKEYAVGLGYKFGAARVGLGYEVRDPKVGQSSKLLSLSVSGEVNGITGAVYYADGSGAIKDLKAYGIGGAYTTGATTIKGYVQKAEFSKNSDITWYGLGAAYDLGGGASIEGGIMDTDVKGQKAVADLGLKFKF